MTYVKSVLSASAGALLLIMSAGAAQAEPLPVPSGTYRLEPTHGSIIWKISHLGLSHYTARLNHFDATITLDSEHPENSSVTATIDPTSVDTDYPNADKKDFNAEIAYEDKFFNANKFPHITFQSTGIELTGGNTGKITGDLTFLGVTKPVTLDVTLNGTLPEHPMTKTAAIGFSAHTTVDRGAFGMDYGAPYIGNDVEVLIEAEFLKAE